MLTLGKAAVLGGFLVVAATLSAHAQTHYGSPAVLQFAAMPVMQTLPGDDFDPYTRGARPCPESMSIAGQCRVLIPGSPFSPPAR